ncbi:LptF/LptG family permease [Aliarcobacter cryaerophilus]|uniref:LptF/LptG family permease n=2 Tax=unclassified Arcobacter TaxID=2593671 RepID=A0AA96CNK9_9BACT|nr:LptF/LptG family permease [Arcobacter sp. AZ-2023]WPD09142.1 LptF/LptG family permease [Arcobacter sp. DSM 115954]WNL13974.1 LptF/LptG family permease [Arcobacter sp. AZ-2023]WNL20145.1 LptF/LptG family permease [Arcobacter sp. AZ-2023]WNL22287.1 LptF/LptG family permease [Arcobacter sp. AZ-2023]
MRLSNYLHSQLAISFFPIFLGLFFITSVVFLVKIVSLTSVIKMNFIELFSLYLYTVPQILLFTLPISYFLSLVISISKLSSEYEMTVITSFGVGPLNIVKKLLPITLLISIALLVITLGLIPKAKYLMNSFIDYKKNEANFNIKESEFGQKFGDWLIFIEKKEDNIYKNVKLFKKENNKEELIVSETAILENKKGNLTFKLFNGKIFIIDDSELNEIGFETMYINEIVNNQQILVFSTSLNYWILSLEYNLDNDSFVFFILTSIFPLISLMLVITFGYFNPRYEKNRAVAYSIGAVVLYYVLIKYIGDRLLLHSLYIIPTIWIIASYILYSKTIKKEY